MFWENLIFPYHEPLWICKGHAQVKRSFLKKGQMFIDYANGHFNMLAAAEADTQFTISDLFALKKQCLFYFYYVARFMLVYKI